MKEGEAFGHPEFAGNVDESRGSREVNVESVTEAKERLLKEARALGNLLRKAEKDGMETDPQLKSPRQEDTIG